MVSFEPWGFLTGVRGEVFKLGKPTTGTSSVSKHVEEGKEGQLNQPAAKALVRGDQAGAVTAGGEVFGRGRRVQQDSATR